MVNAIPHMNRPWRKLASRWILVLPLALVTAIALTSCEEAPKSADRDRELAVQLIEQGDSGAAIALLTPRLERDSEDRKTRLVLASAYAARGGILMKEYADIAFGILDSARETQRLFDERGVVVFKKIREHVRNDNEKSLIDAIEKGYKAIWQVSELIRAFDRLPELSGEAQYDDVVRAIQILEEDPGLEGGPVLYRALLRLVIFRYRLAEHYELPELKACKVDLGALLTSLQEMQGELTAVMDDFKNGVREPDRVKDIPTASEEMYQVFDDAYALLGGFQGLGPVDLSTVVTALNGRCE